MPPPPSPVPSRLYEFHEYPNTSCTPFAYPSAPEIRNYIQVCMSMSARHTQAGGGGEA